jgi:hypothetical protein
VTRCKYCRAEVDESTARFCLVAGECRDAMRDRERRIVRVFWRVYFDVPESRRRDCACGESYCLRCCPESTDYEAHRDAREWGVGWAQTKCIPTRLVRVTVRRKAKS